jgi:hypothetical protein
MVIEEKWRDVVGWEESHEVSDLGGVRAKTRTFFRSHNKTRELVEYTYAPHVLKKWISSQTGYPMVDLRYRGRKTKEAVHALVLEAFVGPRPDGLVACHNDGTRTNNALSNLRWDSYSGNEADKVRHGTSQRGERNHVAKLTRDDVRDIRIRLQSESCASIARSFRVTPEAISHIKLRKTWAWLDEREAA